MPENWQKFAASLLPASVFVLCFGLAAQAGTHRLAIDRPVEFSGVTVACTGLREEKAADWRDYPVEIESVGADGTRLDGETLTLRNQEGWRLLHVECDGQSLMLRLEPGAYMGRLAVPGAPSRHIAFIAPRHGRRDVVIHFQTTQTEHRAS